MIHKACEKLTELGFVKKKKFDDGFGTIGYGMWYNKEPYILVAKEYAFDNLASFIAQLVVNLPDEVDYIFYNNDDKSFTLFDGRYLKRNSRESEGPSKKRDCKWREIDLKHGVDVEDYITGNESPEKLSGKNSTISNYL